MESVPSMEYRHRNHLYAEPKKLPRKENQRLQFAFLELISSAIQIH